MEFEYYNPESIDFVGYVRSCKRIVMEDGSIPDGWRHSDRIIHSNRKGVPQGSIVVEQLKPGQVMAGYLDKTQIHVCPDTLRMLKKRGLIRRARYNNHDRGMWYLSVENDLLPKFQAAIKGEE